MLKYTVSAYGGEANSIVGEFIFIYSCSQTKNPIDSKRLNCAEYEYMNMRPSPIIVELATPLGFCKRSYQ